MKMNTWATDEMMGLLIRVDCPLHNVDILREGSTERMCSMDYTSLSIERESVGLVCLVVRKKGVLYRRLSRLREPWSWLLL
jgi:hypothetical protein